MDIKTKLINNIGKNGKLYLTIGSVEQAGIKSVNPDNTVTFLIESALVELKFTQYSLNRNHDEKLILDNPKNYNTIRIHFVQDFIPNLPDYIKT